MIVVAMVVEMKGGIGNSGGGGGRGNKGNGDSRE